jgi:hypothetical protein
VAEPVSDVPISNRLLPSIRPYLEVFGLERLETSPQSIYCYDSDFVLSYFNPAWVSFGLENGHSQQAMEDLLGSNVLENWPATMTKRFMDVFTAVLNMQEIPETAPPSVRYLCHSPDLHREYSMDVLPLADRAGLLLVSHLVVERPHEREVHDLPKNYRDNTGYIMQCANCSKVRHPKHQQQWDLVLEYIENPVLQTSHGLCSSCFKNYLLLTEEA